MTILQSLYNQCCSIESLQMMLRHRHYQTHMHCERMVLMANEFAEACSLDAHDRDTLMYSAMFHDIGKIGIPDDILMFPGELDANQRSVMELHSTVGETIVRLMQLQDGDEIASHVRHHHEHFDGSGYPDGLKGGDIPLLARMLTILDSYDALRELRSYREALTHDETVAIMDNESDIVHDPDLLERFFSIESIKGIGNKYNVLEKR